MRLQDQSVRALTITGTGGIGKTRLAIEVAHALRYDFEDGVYFVELASLNAAGLVTDAVARALSVKERSGQSQAETLRTYVRSKHMLLVIDNFEHVVEAASFIAELLAACPTLKVLATSREPLNIRAEQLFSLGPLANVERGPPFARRSQDERSGV